MSVLKTVRSAKKYKFPGNLPEMYVTVDIDPAAELNTRMLHPSKKAYTPITRYDAQYALLTDL